MVLRVDKVLGIVHDLHGRAAVDRQLDAVLGGQGVLDDLLGAVRMDEHGHRAGFHVGNGDLDLGVAGILGQLDLDGGGGIAVAGSLDLHGSLHRLAVLLRVLDGLAAESGLRRGLAVLVGLHRAGGAVSGLGLGDGAAVGIGGCLDGRAVLLCLSLDLGAVGLGLGLNLGAVGLGGGIGLAGSGGGIVPVRGRTAATATAGGRTAAGAAGAAAGRAAGGLGLNGQGTFLKFERVVVTVGRRGDTGNHNVVGARVVGANGNILPILLILHLQGAAQLVIAHQTGDGVVFGLGSPRSGTA